jgi:predicted O-methyltransferase YrrM
MKKLLHSIDTKREVITRGRWSDGETLVFPDVSFDVTILNSATHQSTPEKFVLVKTRRMIEYYRNLLSRFKMKNIFEIGIFKGSSMVFFYKLCKPNKIAAIEVGRDENRALAEFVARKGLTKVMRPIYGVNQADADVMRKVIEEEFNDETIDLIIDDGCHYLDETRKSFNAT